MFKSTIKNENIFNETEEILNWIKNRNNEISVNIKQIPFSEMDNWHQDKDGCLRHTSGKFFSIEGFNIKTDFGDVSSWDQPLINQPEVGYLGILSKEFDGVLYFLMQAKIEPGNVNCVQISPTLQATKSNYSKVHKGKKPAYLNYFINIKPNQILFDQLQSEQGARFLRKRNRNLIIKIDDDVEVLEDFRWMTLRLRRWVRRARRVARDAISYAPGGQGYEAIRRNWEVRAVGVARANKRVLEQIQQTLPPSVSHRTNSGATHTRFL